MKYLLSSAIASFLCFCNFTYAADCSASGNNEVCVTIDNQSGKELYIFLKSSSSAGSKPMYYRFSNDPNVKGTYSSEYSSKSIPTGKTTFKLDGSGITGGGRLYVSSDQWHTGQFTADGIPDLATYNSIYDKVELGWNASGTAVWNTTQVDFLGIPLRLTQDGSSVGFKAGTNRAQLIKTLDDAMSSDQSEVYKVKKDDTGAIVRIYSPAYSLATGGGIPRTANENIVQQLIKLCDNSDTKFTYGANTYSDFKFMPPNSMSATMQPAGGQQKSITISNINVRDAYSGTLTYTSPDGAQFAGMLSASIIRGVLGDPSKWGESGGRNDGYPQDYYKGNASVYQYNLYAKILHDSAIDNKIYASSYDDFWKQDSSLNVGGADHDPVTITVYPFNSNSASDNDVG